MVGEKPRRRVKINEKVVETPSNADTQEKKKSLSQFRPHWPEALKWIPNNWTWAKIKPVARSSLSGWTALVLFLIPRVQQFLGNAGYLIVIASFLSPPSEPFVAVFMREALVMLFVVVAWAWACLGIKLANLARTNTTFTPVPADIYSGRYVQAAPAVILAVFMFFGSAFFLYIKARKGPGPYIFATVFACSVLDISMLTMNLFPFPFYQFGKSVVIPLGLHSALVILASVLFFPTTISSQVTTKICAVIDPLLSSFSHHRALLSLNPYQDKEAFSETLKALNAAAAQSEGALLPLAAAAKLLPRDIIICRFAPTDFKDLQESMRRLAVRANGLVVYYSLIDPNKERFPVTPVQSHPGTPASSRHPSPERYQRRKEQDIDAAFESTSTRGRSHLRDSSISPASTPTKRFAQPHPHLHHHHSLHNSLLHLSMSKHSLKRTYPVGVFESQKYLNLESASYLREHTESREHHLARATELLNQSCTALLDESEKALKEIRGWFEDMRQGRLFAIFSIYADKEKKRRKDLLQRLEDAKEQLDHVLKRFRDHDRHAVLEPYLSIFNPTEEDGNEAPPPHQYLFHCYVHQFHIIQFALRLSILLDQIITLEKQRKRVFFWGPARSWFMAYHSWQVSEDPEQDDDDDPGLSFLPPFCSVADVVPDTIRGMEPDWVQDLGEPHRRDPDALPPRNVVEYALRQIWVGINALGRGNTLFALKAGALTVILSIPSLLRSTAGFAYENKFFWGIFMGQLTLARFRGDTIFGFVARITATLGGGVVGLVLWYISTGSAYGIAIVCGVCYPFFFYARLYWPTHPMTNMIFFVTIALVLGFSYQGRIFDLPGDVGSGWEVAWRRFVLVVCGVAAAFLFSFLPPSTTIRVYQRIGLSTTLSEMGNILCAITGYGIVRHEEEVPEIITSLIAVRSKLIRSILAKQNAIYELSLRGRWPAERYQTITKLQVTLAYQLSHLLSVMVFLEPAWGQALLRRTRLQDSTFQGELLSVIAMISNSLRHGSALPQITPCPLIERFQSRFHGLDVIHKDSEEDYGLPRLLTRETLENEQYLMFCVGVSTTYGIVNTLDRLMMAVKEVVGEQYHIHGAGFEWAKGGTLGGSKATSAQVSVDSSPKV